MRYMHYLKLVGVELSRYVRYIRYMRYMHYLKLVGVELARLIQVELLEDLVCERGSREREPGLVERRTVCAGKGG